MEEIEQEKVSSTHEHDIRCRICYESSEKLISICGCTGTIQYVHEECILNWITRKL